MREGWGPGGPANSGRVEGAGVMVSGREEAAEPRGARGRSQGWGLRATWGRPLRWSMIVAVLQSAELALSGGPGSKSAFPPLCQGVQRQKSVLAR